MAPFLIIGKQIWTYYKYLCVCQNYICYNICSIVSTYLLLSAKWARKKPNPWKGAKNNVIPFHKWMDTLDAERNSVWSELKNFMQNFTDGFSNTRSASSNPNFDLTTTKSKFYSKAGAKIFLGVCRTFNEPFSSNGKWTFRDVQPTSCTHLRRSCSILEYQIAQITMCSCQVISTHHSEIKFLKSQNGKIFAFTASFTK